jgi:hypothetical protein
MWILSAILTVGALSVSPHSPGRDTVVRNHLIELVIQRHRCPPNHHIKFGPKHSTLPAVVCNCSEGLGQHHSNLAAVAFKHGQTQSVVLVHGSFIFLARAFAEKADLITA